MESTLFVEKYRPKELSEFIGSEDVKNKIQSYLTQQDIPHILLFGRPGVGKCLDYSECIDIEMDVSEDEKEILKKFELIE